MQFVFPFEHVKHGSRIIIYGAGKVGQIYWRQVERTQYAEIVCLADQCSERYQGIGIEVVKPVEIQKREYDQIVIAMSWPALRQEVVTWLQETLGIPQEKIIQTGGQPVSDFVIRDTKLFVPRSELAFQKADVVSLAICQGSGFGDIIMLKPDAVELASWDIDIRFDLFVHPSRYRFAEVLYRDVPAINRVIPAVGQYAAEYKNYDIAVTFKADLDLDWWNKEKLLAEKPQLAEKLLHVEQVKEQYGFLNGSEYFVHYERCARDGLNAFTAYNRYGFHRTGWQTTVPMDETVQPEYEAMHLGRYITLNYGWGIDTGLKHRSGKIWPFSSYEELVRYIRARYPKLRIVQIGLKNTPRIAGCDTYVMGQDIELVKYVLRGSLLHIDCEGGMTHVATQLGTKCIVMFGMTPLAYYGYPVNINLQAGSCQNCYWLAGDYVSCYRGYEEPPCMKAIAPEMVMQHVEEYLGNGSDSVK